MPLGNPAIRNLAYMSTSICLKQINIMQCVEYILAPENKSILGPLALLLYLVRDLNF
jgi:hypothetical protein